MQPEASHNATDAGNKESSSCGVCGGKRNKTFTGRNISLVRGLARTSTCVCVCVCKRVWVHTRRVCVCWDFYKHACGHSFSVILAFPTFLPVNFQSAWGSLFQSSDIMRGFHSAFHVLPPALSQSHPYLEVRGRESQMMTQRLLLPRGILSTSVLCVCMCVRVCVCVSIINVYQCAYDLLKLKTEFYICRESKMVTAPWK